MTLVSFTVLHGYILMAGPFTQNWTMLKIWWSIKCERQENFFSKRTAKCVCFTHPDIRFTLQNTKFGLCLQAFCQDMPLSTTMSLPSFLPRTDDKCLSQRGHIFLTVESAWTERGITHDRYQEKLGKSNMRCTFWRNLGKLDSWQIT